MKHEARLNVQLADKRDVYGDVVRIRKGDRGNIPEGSICKISIGGNSVLRAIRGLSPLSNSVAIIKMDMKTRKELKVEARKEYHFKLEKVWWFGQFSWAWNASDPTPRLASRLGIISVFLGFISIVLGGVTFFSDNDFNRSSREPSAISDNLQD